jgi:hypothetical protein
LACRWLRRVLVQLWVVIAVLVEFIILAGVANLSLACCVQFLLPLLRR